MPAFPPDLRLRPPTPADVPTFFALQSDPLANQMAGTKPRTREVFFARWEQIFADPRIHARVIELDSARGPELVGLISVFQAPPEGRPTGVPGAVETVDYVGYWIGRAHWGRGIASRALAMFLELEPRRPLHATAARANAPSLRILEKCGFRCTGHRMGEETERYVACEVASFVLE